MESYRPLARALDYQHRRVMASQGRAILRLDATQIFSTPSVSYLVRIATLEFGNLVPDRSTSGSGVIRVEHQHKSPPKARRWARPVLGWVNWVKRPVWVISPFVRVSGAANDRILVEFDEVLVLDRGQVGLTQRVQLEMRLVRIIRD